jgi:ribosomal protein S18 acetylase RimI-like enzyme
MTTVQHLYEVCDATWPPARFVTQGPWTLREGQGGGKRVSAASATGPVTEADIDAAIAGLAAMDQKPLFQIREGDDALDEMLAARGFTVIDPVVLYATPVETLTDIPIPKVTAFAIWEPLAIMEEIWAKGGIGPARLAVMARAKLKTAILSRWNEKPGGVAFAAIHDGVCMVHAVEVLPHQRRQGVADWMMRKAALWAQENGAHSLSVLCVATNTAANALYRKSGFTEIGRYHYRHLEEKP